MIELSYYLRFYIYALTYWHVCLCLDTDLVANIALGKPTSQSSTKPGVDDQSFTSSWAVDGAIDGSPHSHFARTDAA